MPESGMADEFASLDLPAFFKAMEPAEVTSERRMKSILTSTGWDTIERPDNP
jgi:hypothetical protein